MVLVEGGAIGEDGGELGGKVGRVGKEEWRFVERSGGEQWGEREAGEGLGGWCG